MYKLELNIRRTFAMQQFNIIITSFIQIEESLLKYGKNNYNHNCNWSTIYQAIKEWSENVHPSTHTMPLVFIEALAYFTAYNCFQKHQMHFIPLQIIDKSASNIYDGPVGKEFSPRFDRLLIILLFCFVKAGAKFQNIFKCKECFFMLQLNIIECFNKKFCTKWQHYFKFV